MKFSRMLVLSLSLALTACGGGSGSGKNSKAAAILGAASTALESTGGALSAKNFFALSTEQKAVSADCEADSNGSGQTINTDMFPLIVCMFETNTKSPDTFVGALHLVNEVMSKAEQEITFEYAATPTVHEDVTLNLDLADKTIYNVSFREQALVSSEWNYKIEIALGASFDESAIFSVIYLKDSNGVIGAKMLEIDSNNLVGALEILIDYQNGVLRYENWDAKNERHTRLYVAGNIQSSGSVSGLTSVALAHGDAGISIAPNGGQQNNATMVAISDGTNVEIDLNSQDATLVLYNDYCAQGNCAGLTVPAYHSNFMNHNINSNGLEAFIAGDTGGMITFTPDDFALNSYTGE